MRTRAGSLFLAAAAAFVVVVIVRLPARWAAVALPRGIACGQLAGTVWSGTCGNLTQRGMPLGDLAWSLHPLRLLTGALSADVSITRAAGAARARIDVGPSGAVTARGIQLTLPLDHALLAALPPGIRGTAQARLESLRWNGKRVTRLRGTIDVRGLTDARGEPLGDYRLAFPGGTSADPVGRLSDLGGPLSVEGTVRLTREPGYVVNAQVAARPGAPPDIANALRFLGPPDASGHRPFSLEGTF